jgi:hypothetical protein
MTASAASRLVVMALGAGPDPGMRGAPARLSGWRRRGCRRPPRTGRTARSRRAVPPWRAAAGSTAYWTSCLPTNAADDGWRPRSWPLWPITAPPWRTIGPGTALHRAREETAGSSPRSGRADSLRAGRTTGWRPRSNPLRSFYPNGSGCPQLLCPCWLTPAVASACS